MDSLKVYFGHKLNRTLVDYIWILRKMGEAKMTYRQLLTPVLMRGENMGVTGFGRNRGCVCTVWVVPVQGGGQFNRQGLVGKGEVWGIGKPFQIVTVLKYRNWSYTPEEGTQDWVLRSPHSRSWVKEEERTHEEERRPAVHGVSGARCSQCYWEGKLLEDK